MSKKRFWIGFLFLILLICLFSSACGPEPEPEPEPDTPCVHIYHSPIIATSAETVTFTATVCDEGAGPVTIEMLVNAAIVQTCNNLSTGDTCTYTGGPYGDYEGTTVSYLANGTDSEGTRTSKGYYYFAITDSNYNWGLNYMPVRRAGNSADKIDLVFHHTADYASFANFVSDVQSKVYSVYRQQAIVSDTANMDKFNFFIYSKVATTNSCGTVHADANIEISFRDVDAVLHVANMTDCTNLALTHFTAEGGNTKAFLHESGHGVFKMADEYDASPGCSTHYFEPANEPNIFDTQAGCQAEQTAKGRATSACRKFTTCQGEWWGIHGASDNTVMQRGNVGDIWATEGEEHVDWEFDRY
jgi:hypothetical protein